MTWPSLWVLLVAQVLPIQEVAGPMIAQGKDKGVCATVVTFTILIPHAQTVGQGLRVVPILIVPGGTPNTQDIAKIINVLFGKSGPMVTRVNKRATA